MKKFPGINTQRHPDEGQDLFKLSFFFILLLLLFSCSQQKTIKLNPEAAAYINHNISNLQYWRKHHSSYKYLCDAGHIGFWGNDTAGLPLFQFTASLPVKTFNKIGEKVNDPSDPWFILGNYRFTSFIHVSGTYDIFTMERAIARLNYNDEKNQQLTWSQIIVGGKKFSLSGMESEITSDSTEKIFGTGFAQFNYPNLSGLKISRMFSTRPSADIHDGCSAFLLTVKIDNTSDSSSVAEYSEGLQVRYNFRFRYNPPYINPRSSYPVVSVINDKENLIMVRFNAIQKTPFVFADSLDNSLADGFPPMVCLQVVQNINQSVILESFKKDDTTAMISGKVKCTIRPRSSVLIHYIIGYDQKKTLESWKKTSSKFSAGISSDQLLPFRNEWKKCLPELANEKDEPTRTEMRWHSYVLHSMATWSDFYQTVYIPQGNLYEYQLGVSACINDFMDHSLPLAFYDTALCKSILRFGLQHADFHGSVTSGDEGAGRIPMNPVKKSHSELYVLMAVAEYLSVTNDASFLLEKIPFRGISPNANGTVLDRLTRCFTYIRDEIYHGKHGLMRTLSGDLNDCVYFFFDGKYPKINYYSFFASSETPGNTAMAIYNMALLSESLEKMKDDKKLSPCKKELNDFILAMQDYKKELFQSLSVVWGNHPYPCRLMMNDIVYGQDTMFLESQAYTVGIKDFSLEKRQALWKEIKTRLFDPEKKACRIYDKPFTFPVIESDGTVKNVPEWLGEHESGGTWNYLHTPMMVGIMDIDRASAEEGLKKITLMHHAEIYPDYCVGMWSGPDSYNSSFSNNEGLGSEYTRPFPLYCAHQHAWPLWLYFKLRE
jgi:hypothetical protein